ncbi:hypothetical protein ABT288_37270 [Streptomyces sp. NPDC001093]|uniref:hypothetical protein n=1 Tax=Streptomyces sp. NPDC001093 TaxID=3154376 RepID=UPI003316C66B
MGPAQRRARPSVKTRCGQGKYPQKDRITPAHNSITASRPASGRGDFLRSEEYPDGLRDDDPPPWGDSHERARLLARGEAILDVLPALEQAPYGKEDVAVVFSHLDFTNRAIVDYFQYEDKRTMLVAFALAHPQNRPLSTNDGWKPHGPVHPVRTCLAHTFKLAIDDGPLPPLTSIATRHFGPALVNGETWG